MSWMPENLHRHSCPVTLLFRGSSTWSILSRHVDQSSPPNNRLVSHKLGFIQLSPLQLRRPVSSLLSSLQPTGANLSCVHLGYNVRVSQTMHGQLTARESSQGPRCWQDIGNGSHCAGSNQEQLSSSISRVSFFLLLLFFPLNGACNFFPDLKLVQVFLWFRDIWTCR